MAKQVDGLVTNPKKRTPTMVFHWASGGWSYLNTAGDLDSFCTDLSELVDKFGLPGIICHSSMCECMECPDNPLDTLEVSP